MPSYPTLASLPLINSYEHTAAQDPVIRSQTEAGYRQTRPRFTRVPKKWHISYGDLSDADQATLEAFEVTVKYGADLFTWTHPKTATQYSVRFAAPIKYKFTVTDSIWAAEFDLEEV
jgi:phage-related protein